MKNDWIHCYSNVPNYIPNYHNQVNKVMKKQQEIMVTINKETEQDNTQVLII